MQAPTQETKIADRYELCKQRLHETKIINKTEKCKCYVYVYYYIK